MRYLLQNLRGEAAGTRRELERERLQALSIFVEIIHPLIEKLSIRLAVVEQVAGDGRKPDQVRARAGMQEEIGAARHFVLPEVRDNQLLTVQLVCSLHACGQHGMALRRI